MATGTRQETWSGPGSGAGDCPRCGAAYAPLQEYCLECGARLPEDPIDEPGPLAAGYLGPGAAAAWPLLATLVAAVIAVATVLGLRLTDGGAHELVVATTDPPTIVTATEPPPEEEPPVPTLPTPAMPPPPTVPPASTTTTTPARGALIEWPARDGWTIVLLSAADRDTAAARAREASQAGIDDVGVLDSSLYASLHPGYFVVFTGVYDSPSEAESALEEVQEEGFPAAYVREIARAR